LIIYWLTFGIRFSIQLDRRKSNSKAKIVTEAIWVPPATVRTTSFFTTINKRTAPRNAVDTFLRSFRILYNNFALIVLVLVKPIRAPFPYSLRV